MELINIFLDWFLHLDEHLLEIVGSYGLLTYGLLFLIIFLETGIVIAPFLPGDSLIFTAGTLAALGSLNVFTLMVVLSMAAIFGDTVNYWIGHAFGNQVINGRLGNLVKKEHIEKTKKFFDKYGIKTIILARFIPIVRTLAPFLAGTGKMNYSRFIMYNIIGGIVWVGLFLGAGFLFGDLPIVKDNFSAVILIIIFSTVVPLIVEWIKSKRKTKFKREN